MEGLGFSSKWVDRIMMCVETVTYSVLINGIPSKEFTPRRGIRQGDPLSPYLFLICVKGLSALLNREESLSNLSGFQINKRCPVITHLFFADDSLIFFKATDKEANSIKGILEEYEQVMGQRINLEKSECMFSKNVSVEQVGKISNTLGVKQSNSLGYYLGLSAQTCRNKRVMFKRLKDRVWKVLQGWKRKLFSLGGKEVLIKVIAQAIPTYTMNCFKLPKSICADINKMCAQFWWVLRGKKEMSLAQLEEALC